MAEIWVVLGGSLLFILAFSVLGFGGVWVVRSRLGGAGLRCLVRQQDIVRVTSRKLIPSQPAIIEVEWRGKYYLLHVAPHGAEIIDCRQVDGKN
ncbi:hypothetical protein ACTSKR_08535 [Chitinibacteraceae bacterium HSL-7]